MLELELESYSTGLVSSQRFWDKSIVVFNTASFCGFTHQVSDFQEMFESGAVVPIALPTNEFGAQEPGDNYEITQFLKSKFRVTFPICMKTNLEHKLFKTFGAPSWNFNKYLFDRKHNFIKRFDSKTEPKELLSYV